MKKVAKPRRTPSKSKSKPKPKPKAKPAKPATVPSAVETELANLFTDPDEFDLDQFAELPAIKPVDRRERGLVKLDGSTVVTGDFIIDGDLEMNGQLIVLGSLRCTGFVFTGIHCPFVVRGDVTARAVEALRSYWLVGGSITTETAWLSTYGFLMLAGELRARLLVVQMFFSLVDEPSVVAKTVIETDYMPKDPAARARLDAVLDTRKLVDDKGDFDSWALLRQMSKHANVFRSGR